MDYLVKKHLNFISSNVEDMDEIKLDRIRYGLEVFYYEISKFIILFIIAFSLNLLSEFLVILLSLPIRFFIGGSHCFTYWGCLLKSFVFCSLILILNPFIPIIPFYVQSLILLMLISIVFLKKDKININRGIISKKKRRNQKIFATSLIIIYVFYSNLFLTTLLTNCMLLTIAFIILDYLFKED